MTIAIGMLCQGGLIIAADTQATHSDGTTHERVKVRSQKSANGLFSAAYSSDDMNAAEMLIGDTLNDLKLLDPSSQVGVEDAIKDRMTQWSSTFLSKDNQFYTAFILGSRVAGNSVCPDRLGMYYCEPPGKCLRQTIENSKGYIAAGGGSVITDPLVHTLFGKIVPPRICLGQISYLMYRAKKECGGACGGETDAVLLLEDNPEPVWIERSYMKHAEQRGVQFDETTARLLNAIMARNGFDDKSRFASFFDRKNLSRDFGLSGFAFRARNGEMIREREFQEMMDNPEKYLER